MVSILYEDEQKCNKDNPDGMEKGYVDHVILNYYNKGNEIYHKLDAVEGQTYYNDYIEQLGEYREENKNEYKGDTFDFTEKDFYYASLIEQTPIGDVREDKNKAVRNLKNMAKELCGDVTEKQVTKSASRKLKTFFVKTDNCSKDSLIYKYKTATDAGKVVSKFNKAIEVGLTQNEKVVQTHCLLT